MIEKAWMVYNGPNHDVDWFETREEAESCIKELIADEIEEASQNGFSGGCDEYFVLQVSGRAKLSLWKKREDMEIDKEGYDEEGDYWPDDVVRYCHLKYVTIQEVDGNAL